jgi:hypothetical protein
LSNTKLSLTSKARALCASQVDAGCRETVCKPCASENAKMQNRQGNRRWRVRTSTTHPLLGLKGGGTGCSGRSLRDAKVLGASDVTCQIVARRGPRRTHFENTGKAATTAKPTPFPVACGSMILSMRKLGRGACGAMKASTTIPRAARRANMVCAPCACCSRRTERHCRKTLLVLRAPAAGRNSRMSINRKMTGFKVLRSSWAETEDNILPYWPRSLSPV